MRARYLLPAVLLTSVAIAQDSWLQFNAGAPENSSPLVQFNGTWDSFLTYDVELRGLLAETVTVDSQAYLRFSHSPGTVPSDSVGWPELLVVRRMVWLPDDSDISLEYSANCCEGIECLPVYPVPLDSLVSDSTCTPFIGEYFRLDSTAYASEEWYPDTLARLVGEFRLRDLRVGIVDVYPVQYLASEDSLQVWSDIEVSLSWDAENAVWSEADLGHFDNLIGDNLLGYTPEPQPLNDGDGSVVRLDWDELEDGPGYAPDYVILVAAGLDGQAVTALANHRDDLNGFDVAIVRTDDVLTCYGGQVLTADMIRDFTEDMWKWGSGPGDRPTYLLLIGDHEDPAYASQAWFLPTHLAWQGDPCWYWANDSWFVLFGENRSTLSAWPDMIVGRLPARTSAELASMVDLIEDFEEPSSWPPPQSVAWRRYLTRLSGQNKNGPYTPYDPWVPTDEWASAFADWLGYGYDNLNCGDGDDETNRDGSDVTAHEWVDTLTEWFERGQQVAFYVNHGETHMYSAGIQWLPDPPSIVVPPNMGVPDSVFDSFDVSDLGVGTQNHVNPFVVSLCCLNGTFNHTVAQHYYEPQPGEFYWECMHFDPLHSPPLWDYGTDCLAETWMKNAASGAIGVFASSEASSTGYYESIGMNLLRSIYYRGMTRTGDAIASMRLGMLDAYNGGYNDEMGRFNLLGDPAVDIGDRVKFPHRCDLVISTPELRANRYPTRSIDGEGTAQFQVVVHNYGGAASGRFPVELEVQWGQQSETLTAACAGLQPGESETLRFDWELPQGFTVPATVSLRAVVDPDGDCPDSWTANNDASIVCSIEDLYPNETGWPVLISGSVKSPPALGDLDGDGDMEIVVVSGCLIEAIDPDDPGSPLWSSEPFMFNPGEGSGFTIPVIANVYGSTLPEIICDSDHALLILSGSTGEAICAFSHDSPELLSRQGAHSPIVGEFWPGGGNEIGLICRDSLNQHCYLTVLRVVNSQVSQLGAWDLPYSVGVYFRSWICAGQLTLDSTHEIVVSYSRRPGPCMGVWTWDFDESTSQAGFVDSYEWSENANRAGIPALGDLAGQGMTVALSHDDSYADQHNPIFPAFIMDPLDLESSLEECWPTSTPSSNILCCMMADWDPLTPGLDRIIAPAENQCFAWDEDGLIDWSIVFGTLGDPRPPFGALGDLDDNGYSDLLVGTRSGVVMAFDRDGVPLTPLGFPYKLPSEVYGGYCIADIDLDGRVEVVFGTMDNYLHVWELGECVEGYAPWPQVQHDAARTGVLE